MPRSSTGRWVARAGATGGGRTYRGQMPVNWYASLVLIVIVGLASIVFARVDYRNGATTNTTPPLKGGTPWLAGIAFDVCGTQQPSLPANALDTTKQSFYTVGNGVIIITPKKTSDAGHNAVLGKFVSAYTGLTLTATELHLPGTASSTAKSTTKSTKSAKKARTSTGKTYKNGEKCPAGTKDAGKKADVEVAYWANAFSSKQTSTTAQGNPATLLFSDNQLITVGFVPPGTKLPKPSTSVVTALRDEETGAKSTTTTTPSATTTTTPTSTSTTTSSSSTSTSTTAPSSSTTTSTTKAG